MDKIRLAVIVNNFNKDYDGIGSYASNLVDNFSDRISPRIYTDNCRGDDKKIKKIISTGMTKAIFRATKDIRNIDAVLIEYPFVEWNPAIIPALQMLKRKCSMYNVKIFLSLHEYSRVNRLRRNIIRSLIRISDCIFVSNNETKDAISEFGKKIYLRDIPTNIFSEKPTKMNKIKQFVFFGLINKAKAFNEMLAGWDTFNSNNEYHLDILTSTEYTDLEEHRNVQFHYRLSNDEIMNKMCKSRYCILPILPEVDAKNATFKTGALCGCVCIGVFSQEYKNLQFIINMNDYSPSEFTKALDYAVKIDNHKLDEMKNSAEVFGRMFTPYSVAEDIENRIISELNRK